MKTYSLILFFAMTFLASASCTHKVVIVKRTPAKSLPPGQAKKIAGTQSAKPFAPGQQKKKN